MSLNSEAILHDGPWYVNRIIPNEFGYIYLALYILGNYARYYPDKWLADVEKNSPLALAVDEFIHVVEQRLALLTYGELARTYFVPDD
jgi:hypothetical protein